MCEFNFREENLIVSQFCKSGLIIPQEHIEFFCIKYSSGIHLHDWINKIIQNHI
jgi:hypothetical protein